MLIKRAEREKNRRGLAIAFADQPNKPLDRRSFLRRSGLAAGSVAALGVLPLASVRVLMFVEDSYEDLELWYPKLRLVEAGAHVTVAGPEEGRKYKGKNGYPCVSDAAIAVENDEILEAIEATALGELERIEKAISRIDAGKFTVCEICGEHISAERHAAVAYATQCERCASS